MFQFNVNALLKINTSKVKSPSPQMGIRKQEYMCVTQHMTGSGATTCKQKITLLQFSNEH